MTDKEIIAGTLDDLETGEKPPKPLSNDDKRKLTNDERIARGMKPVGRRPGMKSTGSSNRGKRSLEGELQVAFTLVNYAFAFAPPEFRGDMLDEVEIAALARSLNEAAQSNGRLYDVLDGAISGGGTGLFGVIITVGCIAGRRLARHGFIPANADDNLGVLLQMSLDPKTIVLPTEPT